MVASVGVVVVVVVALDEGFTETLDGELGSAEK